MFDLCAKKKNENKILKHTAIAFLICKASYFAGGSIKARIKSSKSPESSLFKSDIKSLPYIVLKALAIC